MRDQADVSFIRKPNAESPGFGASDIWQKIIPNGARYASEATPSTGQIDLCVVVGLILDVLSFFQTQKKKRF